MQHLHHQYIQKNRSHPTLTAQTAQGQVYEAVGLSYTVYYTEIQRRRAEKNNY